MVPSILTGERDASSSRELLYCGRHSGRPSEGDAETTVMDWATIAFPSRCIPIWTTAGSGHRHNYLLTGPSGPVVFSNIRAWDRKHVHPAGLMQAICESTALCVSLLLSIRVRIHSCRVAKGWCRAVYDFASVTASRIFNHLQRSTAGSQSLPCKPLANAKKQLGSRGLGKRFGTRGAGQNCWKTLSGC
jgi:hypothetical protein